MQGHSVCLLFTLPLQAFPMLPDTGAHIELLPLM